MRFAIWWMVAGLVLVLFTPPLGHYVWVLAILPLVAWLLVGVSYILIRLVQARHLARRWISLRAAGTTALLGLFVLVTLQPVKTLGARLATDAFWAIHHESYERFVTDLATVPSFGKSKAVGPYLVDEGPPARAGFLFTGTATLGWCGYVYDPRGEVLQPKGLTSNSGPRLSGLYGCRELDPPFYVCCSQ